MVDDRGDLVWFRPRPRMTVMDFRVQRYKGEPVLTWWEGSPVKGWGRGEIVIADSSYRTIARVRAKGEWKADHHDHTITPQGTMLVFVYVPVRRNTTAQGGTRNATVMDSVIQEIDIETGRKLFEWRSLDHVGLGESYRPAPDKAADPYDYLHVNSVQVADDGNLLISARNTHAVYKVKRKTGAIIWQLGGKRSNFKMGRGTRFSWQHDARFQPDGSLTIFDNAAAPKTRPQSRGLVLGVNTKRKRVKLKRQYTHPRSLLARSQANMQALPNGNVLIGWGVEPYISEQGRGGKTLLAMRHLGGSSSYRAYRFPWIGRPSDKPALAVRSSSGGRTTVYASWNGATEVTRWRVTAGPSADALKPVGEGRRKGFETRLKVETREPFVAVEALDSSGKVLGASKTAKR